jgi:hypothetical protein
LIYEDLKNQLTSRAWIRTDFKSLAVHVLALLTVVPLFDRTKIAGYAAVNLAWLSFLCFDRAHMFLPAPLFPSQIFYKSPLKGEAALSNSGD